MERKRKSRKNPVTLKGVDSVTRPPLRARDIVRVTIAMAVIAVSRALSALALWIVPPHLRPRYCGSVEGPRG